MHRSIRVAGDRTELRRLCPELVALPGVLMLSHQEDGSLKPEGDVVLIEVLNKGADEVLRKLNDGIAAGKLSVAIAENTTFIEKNRLDDIEHDADEAQWEEMETGLRNQGRLSVNYLLLMAAGGLIAGLGYLMKPTPQVIAFVAASIIAPGFDPITKIALGLVLKRWQVVRRAALSTVVGYALIVAFVAASVFALNQAGLVSADELKKYGALDEIVDVRTITYLSAIAAAFAGALMVASLRDLYVMGPLILLVLIPGASFVGVALGLRQFDLVGIGAFRLAVDIALTVGAGLLVFFWKQRRFHKRKPAI